MKRISLIVFGLGLLTLGASAQAQRNQSFDEGWTAESGLKPRLVVCTDIAPADVEPDDMESMVRLMAYADQFEIEALKMHRDWYMFYADEAGRNPGRNWEFIRQKLGVYAGVARFTRTCKK